MGHVGCGESCMEIGVARWVLILGGFRWGFDWWKEIGPLIGWVPMEF